jgi:hypothetical protein
VVAVVVAYVGVIVVVMHGVALQERIGSSK